jgi:hypothetical protein
MGSLGRVRRELGLSTTIYQKGGANDSGGACSGMTFGVSGGRTSRLLGLEKVKDYSQFGFGSIF